MKLYTRCPHCDTGFRVTPQQLQASGGQVRCGRCDRVFDAFASLSAKQPEAKEKKASVVEPESAIQHPPAAAEDVVQIAPDAVEFEPAATQPDESPADVQVSDQAQPITATPPSIETNLYEWEFRPPKVERSRWPLIIGSLCALLALTTQAAFAFRSQLSLAYPETRVWFARACEQLRCSLPLPRLDDKLNIESSGLEAVDPARLGQILLTATLRNRAAVAVAYPALELTLTDDRSQTIARRVFLPQEYLERRADLNRGFDAGTEVSLRLYLDTADLRAAGYRLYLFYP